METGEHPAHLAIRSLGYSILVGDSEVYRSFSHLHQNLIYKPWCLGYHQKPISTHF